MIALLTFEGTLAMASAPEATCAEHRSVQSMSLEGYSRALAGRQFVDEGVVVIAHRIEGIEGISVIRCERKAFLDPQRQIRICHEVTSEGHGTCYAALDGGFCAVGLEATRCDDLPLKTFRSCSAAIGSCSLWIVTFPFTRGSMMCR